MDNWVEDYSYAIETENLGAGIAPWNIAQYRLVTLDEHGPTKVKCKGKVYTPLFYHFQNMTYIDENTIHSNTHVYWGVEKKLVYSFYIPYATHVALNKKMLKERYGIDVLLHHHPGVEVTKQESFIKVFMRKIKKILSKDSWEGIFYHRIPALLSSDNGVIKF